MVGDLLAELRGQRMEVVPQSDDLGWHARAEQRDRVPPDRRARRSWFFKETALVFDNSLCFEHAESDATVGRLETRPLGHMADLCGFSARATQHAARVRAVSE